MLYVFGPYNSLLFVLCTEAFNDKAGEGKQMLVGGTKSKTAFQDGYFSATFDRVMEVSSHTCLCVCMCIRVCVCVLCVCAYVCVCALCV